MKWDEWRGSGGGLDDAPTGITFYSKTLLRFRGWKVCLHKFVDADWPECFHTHPARALRIILWGGYLEQLENGESHYWAPGDVGIVEPELSHRTDALLKGVSYSLWVRWPTTHKVELRGKGWKSANV